MPIQALEKLVFFNSCTHFPLFCCNFFRRPMPNCNRLQLHQTITCLACLVTTWSCLCSWPCHVSLSYVLVLCICPVSLSCICVLPFLSCLCLGLCLALLLPCTITLITQPNSDSSPKPEGWGVWLEATISPLLQASNCFLIRLGFVFQHRFVNLFFIWVF